jgi:hypothetical protein
MKTLRQDRSEFNVLFVHSELDDLGLDPHEFRIYAHLARRANGKSRAYPGITSMSESCRMKRHTVIRVIRSLEERGLIKVLRKTGGLNEYVLTPPSEWIGSQETSVQSGTGVPNGTGYSQPTSVPNGTGAGMDMGVVSKTTRPPVPNGTLKGNPSEGNPSKNNTVAGPQCWTERPPEVAGRPLGGDPALLCSSTSAIGIEECNEPPGVGSETSREANEFDDTTPQEKAKQSPLVRKAYAMAELMRFQHWDNCKVEYVKQTARSFAEKALRDGRDDGEILKAYHDSVLYCHGVATDEICRRERGQSEKASPALTVWLARKAMYTV